MAIFDTTDTLDLSERMFVSLGQILAPDENTPGLEKWEDIAHEFQLPPKGDWTFWALISGRGAGKTRAAAEFMIEEILSGRSKNPGLIGPTAQDARRIMVLGPAGLVRVAETRGLVAIHEPSKSRVVFPELNISADIFSAETPERLRGPQHDLLWMEELGAWQDAFKGDEEETTWNNAMLGLRMGQHARAIITSTPKPNKLMKHVFSMARTGDVVITTGSTYANRANLSKNFFTQVVQRYEGTRLGRQEIYGELLEDVEGALWTREWIDQNRIAKGDWWTPWIKNYNGWKDLPKQQQSRRRREKMRKTPPKSLILPTPEMQVDEPPLLQLPQIPLPDFARLVVGIDPNTTSNPDADVAGIVVAALGTDGHGYVLDDRSKVMGPTDWSKEAIKSYTYWLADKIIAERNNGGEMVKITIEQTAREHYSHVGDQWAKPNIELVWASRGKVTRAEPAAALYEQGLIHHVGEHKLLEDELCVAVGSLVTTTSGDVPIESIRVGDRVLTRAGWKPVLRSESTGVKTVLHINSTLGHTLRVTGNHPVYVEGRGFIRADALELGDVLTCLNPSPNPTHELNESMWNSKESVTSSERRTVTGRQADLGGIDFYTETFGRQHTGLSLLDMKSTTKTKTSPIIPLITSRLLLEKSIEPNTPANEVSLLGRLNSTERSLCGSGPRNERGRKSVSSAQLRLRPDTQKPASALTNAGKATVESIILEPDPTLVWDLTVEEQPEFFSGGILVHNCTFTSGQTESPGRLDALVWCLTDLFDLKATTDVRQDRRMRVW